MKKLSIFFALALVFAAPAGATVIGTAVSSIGSSTQVGSAASDGTINFYIPVSSGASGTYGVNAGTGVDYCYNPGSCGSGTLDMFLRFDPVQSGPSLLSLDFTDLDIFGAGDTSYFFESVTLFDAAANLIGSVSDTSNSAVVSANTNRQLIEYLVNVGPGPFFVELNFASWFGGNAPQNVTFRNTIENLLPTLTALPVSVPEPATLTLLGAGLILVGFVGRRRKKFAA